MTRSQRIPMSSLTALTLHSDKLTTSRRTSPVPQLTCQGKLCGTYQPDVVQCVPVGSDGMGGLEWSCVAELPGGMRMGAVEVSCEGWDGPDDPYVLKGSCGLTYNLVPSSRAFESSQSLSRSSSISWSSIASIALLAFMIYRFLSTPNGPLADLPARARRWFGGGGGGGGGRGGGGGGPPPPYSPTAPKPPARDGWTPGFWTGLAAGAAALSAANSVRGRQQQGMGRRGDDWDRGVGGSGSWSGGGGGGGGGGMRSSTGFGGTRNR